MTLRPAFRVAFGLAVVAVLGCSSRAGDAPGNASVTFANTWSIADVVVAVQRPDAKEQVLRPDAQGRVTFDAWGGTTVTVGRFFPGTTDLWRLTTLGAVEPGDTLVLDDGTAPAPGAASVSLPGPAAGAAWYYVDPGCGVASTTDPTATVALQVAAPPCGPRIDVLATALSASSGEPIAWATALDVAFADTTAVLGPWHDLDAISLVVTNAPSGTDFVSAYLEPRRSGGRRYSFTQSADASALAQGGAATLAFPYAPGFATTARRTARLYFSDDGVHDDGVAQHVVNEAPIASGVLDLATAMLPRVRDLQITAAGGAWRATWTRTAEDPSVDGQILTVTWEKLAARHEWRVVLPPGATSFTFPALPAELGAHVPPADAAIAGSIVAAYDASEARSYADFKRDHLGLLRDLPGGLLNGYLESGSWTLRSSWNSPTP